MTKDQPSDLNPLRHTAAHLLAAAVLELYPDAKPTIGPPIERGFYYDFDFGNTKISDDDLPKIEKKMQELLTTWDDMTGEKVSAAEARKHFASNPFKLELIGEIETAKGDITLYTAGAARPSEASGEGGFTDLCRGGHLERPRNEIKRLQAAFHCRCVLARG